jgi:membrane protease YdiL (CAAX protease family)
MNNEIRQRPAPFENVSPLGQFFFVIGLFGISIFLFAFIGAFTAIYITHLNLYDLADFSHLDNPQKLLAIKIEQIVTSFGGFIVPAIVFALLASRNKAEYLKINYGGKIITLILGGALMICAMPFINYLGELNSHLQLPEGLQEWVKSKEGEAATVTDAFLAHQTVRGLLLNLFMIGLLAAVGEELFFRAVLQKIIIKGTGSIHIGVWLTGAIFSFVHFEFFEFLPRMLMGVYLGYLFVWSKSIWVPIFAHFVNNASDVMITFLQQRNVLASGIDEVGANSADKIYVIGSTIVIAALLFLIYKIESKRVIAPPTA